MPRIIACEQGSLEWHAARRGIPTASEFHKILTAKTEKISTQSDDYICELIGELHSQFLPKWAQSYTSRAMDYGAETEAEARNFYAMATDEPVERVGFIVTDDGRYGCSPDALVGIDGGLELKCPALKTHVRYLLQGELPPDYKAQVHGALLVTGRPWWDFLSYAPGLPAFLVRVRPDGFTEKLRTALDVFWRLFQERLQRIRDGSWQKSVADSGLKKKLEDSIELETEKAWTEWRQKHGVDQTTLPLFPKEKNHGKRT